MPSNKPAPIHISVVLDRSGSMTGIADEVVGGFNEWLSDQRKVEGDTTVTLAQFDSEDPFDIHIDAVPLREVTDFERSSFQPRGATPLYDGIGRMISHADAGIARRLELGIEAEDHVMVIITDGLENASEEQTRATAFDLIEDRKQQGWVFVFIGANQDVYQTGADLSVSAGNSLGFDASGEGTKRMFSSLSESTARYRTSTKEQRLGLAQTFFETEDPSEEEGDRRG